MFTGGILLAALFTASFWEAQEAAQRNAPAEQNNIKNMQNTSEGGSEVSSNMENDMPTGPCSLPPMWAEGCLVINEQALFIAVGDIADTDAKRSQGLSGRASLPENAGMLFVFDTPAQYSFWMHGMLFPLDFLWIRDEKIIEISQNVPYPEAGEDPQTITPKMPVDMVLEMNAGWAERNNILVGMAIDGLP